MADPQNHIEAGTEMRRINQAYEAILEHLAAASTPAASTYTPRSTVPRSTAQSPRGRMSQQEIDAMVRAIGSEGPLDWLLNGIGWIGNTLEGVLAVGFAVALLIRLMMLLGRRDFSGVMKDPDLVILLGALLFFAGRELWIRSRVRSAPQKQEL